MNKIYLAVHLILFALTSISQSNVENQLEFQSRSRRYIVHLPPNYNPNISRPLVIVLHGGSGSANSVQGFTNMNAISNAFGFLVAYPEGASATGIGGFSWADGRGTSADEEGIDDVGFINAMINQITADYQIVEEKIYVCGFSNGGFMTQLLACEMNDRFAAMASLGATQDEILNASCSPERPIPMMLIHGTADPSAPYEGGPMANIDPDVVGVIELFNFWVANNNCQTEIASFDLDDDVEADNSTVTQFEFTNCDCDADVRHLRINGGGHTWPGVVIPSLEEVSGETNEDIQASLELWLFFNQFELCQVEGTVLSTRTELNQEIVVYPNPVNDQAFISSNNLTIERMDLLDVMGKLVKSVDEINNVGISLSGYQAGVYYLVIQTEKGQLIKRLIKN